MKTPPSCWWKGLRAKTSGKRKNTFGRIASKKTDIDYGVKLARRDDAESLARYADGFLEWVESRMPPEYG